MQFKERLLLENQAWLATMQERDSKFFARLEQGQSPEALWLGCSDSRVPAETLCNASPGDLFVHRNVANIAATEEHGFMSALEYAVTALKVPYIVVCGHEGCGGVGAACSGQASGMDHVDAHLAQLVELYNSERDNLDANDDKARVNAMVRRNVEAQIDKLADLDLIKNAEQPPTLLGLVYALDAGHLDVVCESAPSQPAAA
ncbi:carbonic anhydrase [Salinisphaera japonica]|uniref:Carbonic anhydrase n=1 Tax=Salinisphaera japonica YTM-1 TaxID=1209778 RepID=A0A423PTK8_9GAMM|nr:carbonic anhydrase [Salinisphaera japonica]ROO28924.1 carbonic anhydrase [Salinisphaera japonica YTM-1]